MENIRKKHTARFRSTISFATMGEQCTRYLSAYLLSIGLSALQIGLISSISNVTSIIGDPVWGIASDKLRSVKKVLLICLATSALLYVCVPTVSPMVQALFVLLPLFTFFQQPGQHVMENFLIRSCDSDRLNYGSIRSFGSLSYALLGIALYFVLSAIGGIKVTFYLFGVFYLSAFVICLTLQSPAAADNRKSLSFRELDFHGLFGNYFYVTYMIFTFIRQLALSCTFTFYAFVLTDLGINTNAIGLLFGFGALFEIPSLMLFKKVRRKVPLQYIIMFGCIVSGLEAILLHWCTSLSQLLLLRAFVGISVGITLGASGFFMLSLAPESLKTTAQTLNFAFLSAAGIISNTIGGLLVQKYGAATIFYWVGILAMAAVVFYLGTFVFARLVLKKDLPGVNPG